MISTLTRAELTEEINRRISVTEKYPGLETAQIDAIICKLALAAMDCEPVADVVDWSHPTEERTCDVRLRRHDVEPGPLYRHAQPAPELTAIVDRLNGSGYEYEGWEVTPQNAAAVVNILLQQLDDAVQSANSKPVKRVNADQMQRVCLEANRHLDKYGAMAREVNKLLGHIPAQQPAPVVQCPFPCGWDNLNKLAIQDAALVARGLVEGEPTTEAHRQAAISNNDRLLKVISACRAAMLQAAPVCTCPSGDGSLRWPCPVHPGNSPVIPDGWTGNDKANAALMMLDRIETVDPVDDDRIDGIKRIVRELAAAPQEVK